MYANNLTAAIKGNYGPKNPILTEFGIGPAKTRPPTTSEENLAKAAKAAHTRELRGTKTPKEKAALKSTATVTISTALAAGAGQPGSTVAPAANAPASTSAPASAAPAAPAAPVAAGSAGSVNP